MSPDVPPIPTLAEINTAREQWRAANRAARNGSLVTFEAERVAWAHYQNLVKAREWKR